jgi:hypothetical protein
VGKAQLVLELELELLLELELELELQMQMHPPLMQAWTRVKGQVEVDLLLHRHRQARRQRLPCHRLKPEHPDTRPPLLHREILRSRTVPLHCNILGLAMMGLKGGRVHAISLPKSWP